jgi:cytochrome c553
MRLAPPALERAGHLLNGLALMLGMRGIICLLGAVATLALADAPEAAGAKANLETCFACHGEGGVSQVENVPSIAAEPSYFTQWQLVFYRGGSLKSELMTPVAAELSNDDIRSIGDAVAALSPPKPPAAPDDRPELTTLGAQLVVERHCNNCHAENLAGQQAAARLAGQREEVLLKALHDYKVGKRTGTGVAAMPEVAYSLSEEQMQALAHYLARLP